MQVMSCLELLCKMLVSVVMWHFPSLFRQKKLVSSPEQRVGPSQISASVLHPLLWFGFGTPSCCSGLALERSKIMKVLRHQRQDFPKCILMHLGAYTYELGGLFWDIITFSFEVLRRDRLDPVCDSALDPDVFKTFFIWLLYLVDDTSNRCTWCIFHNTRVCFSARLVSLQPPPLCLPQERFDFCSTYFSQHIRR